MSTSARIMPFKDADIRISPEKDGTALELVRSSRVVLDAAQVYGLARELARELPPEDAQRLARQIQATAGKADEEGGSPR